MLSFKPKNENETPYVTAQQEWDNLIGSSRVQAANWRYAWIALFLLLLLSVWGNIRLGNQLAKLRAMSIRPFLVYVNSQTGEVVKVKEASEDYEIKETSIKSALKKFIKNFRSFSTDEVVNDENYLEACKYVTASGKTLLDNSISEMDRKTKLGELAVSIDKILITKITANSFQIEWRETEFSLLSKKQKIRNFTGVFTIVLNIPETEKELIDNPLGIYSNEFSISERY